MTATLILALFSTSLLLGFNIFQITYLKRRTRHQRLMITLILLCLVTTLLELAQPALILGLDLLTVVLWLAILGLMFTDQKKSED